MTVQKIDLQKVYRFGGFSEEMVEFLAEERIFPAELYWMPRGDLFGLGLTRSQVEEVEEWRERGRG